MSLAPIRVCCLCAFAAPAMWGQFELFSIQGTSEVPVPAIFNLGTAGRGDTLSFRFRLRNVSSAAAAVRVLDVSGTGFSLSGAPQLPISVSPGTALEFSVTFRSQSDGSYSAGLRSEGISVLLIAAVTPQLTVTLAGAPGMSPLTNGSTIGFATVERGLSSSVRFQIDNQTGRDEFVPPVSIQGEDFHFSGASPAGRFVRFQESITFEILFSPLVLGARRAILLMGERMFVLSGTAIEPSLPTPQLSIALRQRSSVQQGTVAVLLSEAARTQGTGTLTLDVQPLLASASDTTIAFASGGRVQTFDVLPGNQQLLFDFQTGSTAGVLTFTVKLGTNMDRQMVEIPAAPVILSLVQAARTGATLDVNITASDNTFTAGPVTFTFFDRAGASILPGAIVADRGSDFGKYFQGSDIGGLFLLKANFPVNGNAADVDAVEVEMSNSAGTAKSGRVRF